ncbi:MlaA family lipoprotein [Plasticicumulans acidivorans]|uniref:Phospholipid-binding lipoprotein MlaA n=1 Tax=Plasticicumulans acidivorans TaxID=886464 RepID=A0A317MZZ1_9GAMM|nr:VacJ family lipoprotein [Plasticicumulans acidivorans]PWV65563.1 phospholipid-binding lipoprotein MlaA [Plasticicumulans acidivorans]
MRRIERTAVAALLAALLSLAGGCAAVAPPIAAPAQASTERVGLAKLDLIEDPWEGFNRRMYRFNAWFDEAVFLPVVRGYRAVTPEFARNRVHDFFNNVADIDTMINAALQLQGRKTLDALARVTLNSTFGLLGAFDVADGLGLPQPQEDFGQTLGYWGVGSGPYLVLPLLGPSSLRDGVGRGVDFAARSAWQPDLLFGNWGQAVVMASFEAVDLRSTIAFRYYQSGSPFEYELLRLLYTKKREIDIGR